MGNLTTYFCDKCNMETDNYLHLYKVKVEKLSNCSPSRYREVTFDICEGCLRNMFDEDKMSEIKKETIRY